MRGHRDQRRFARALASITAFALLSVSISISTASVASAQTVVGDYLFQDTLSDGANTPNFQTIGSGTAFATETVDGASRRVLSWVPDSGLSLSPMSQFNSSSYTMVLLVRFQEVNSYRRLLDFKGTGQNGLYVSDGTLTFFKFNTIWGPASINANSWVQIAITRDASETFTAYVNGAQQFTFTDTDDDALVANDTLRFFVDSDGGVEESAGAIARFRMYNGAMTANQVGGLDRLPGGATPTPTPTPTPQPSSTPTAQPTPTPTPTKPPPAKIRYVTVRDKEGSESALDIVSTKFGRDPRRGRYLMSLTVGDKFGKRILTVPKPEMGAVFMYLDTAPEDGRTKAEYRVRIYYFKGKWESRLENVSGKFKIFGYGTGSHPSPKTLNFNIDADLIPVKQRSIGFYIATAFDANKGKCKRIRCWDYSPDEGFAKYKLD
jgi:hypothetical protein